ncbi:MAG: helix-turn-helix domain-containing protein [Nanoarchaeota archaeon]
MLKDEIIEEIRKMFDLNLYEAKIWLALLSKGSATAGEISEISNVPRSRTYDILEGLEKKGFVISKLSKPIKYIAIAPSEVIERIKKKTLKEAEEKARKIEALRDSEFIKELEAIYRHKVSQIPPNEKIGSIKGRFNLYNHIDYMIRSAEKEVIIMTTSKGFIRKIEVLRESMEKAAKRGVKIKIAAPITEETEEYLDEIKDVAEVKHIDFIKARFIVVDSQEVMLMIVNDEEVLPNYDTGIWLNSPFLAEALKGMFDYIWKDLKPINVKEEEIKEEKEKEIQKEKEEALKEESKKKKK